MAKNTKQVEVAKKQVEKIAFLGDEASLINVLSVVLKKQVVKEDILNDIKEAGKVVGVETGLIKEGCGGAIIADVVNEIVRSYNNG